MIDYWNGSADLAVWEEPAMLDYPVFCRHPQRYFGGIG
jgi:hypothetical protein